MHGGTGRGGARASANGTWSQSTRRCARRQGACSHNTEPVPVDGAELGLTVPTTASEVGTTGAWTRSEGTARSVTRDAVTGTRMHTCVSPARLHTLCACFVYRLCSKTVCVGGGGTGLTLLETALFYKSQGKDSDSDRTLGVSGVLATWS